MKEYSAFRLLVEGLRGHSGWKPTWRAAEPKSRYDVVIIGGGGHGLSTAYYLARNHGVRNVAVLERGWIGQGNTGRNTTVIRSNYYYPESIALFDLSVKLYEGLSRELNYNVMFSPRGMVIAGHSRHDMELMNRWAGAMQAHGVDVDVISADEVKRRVPAMATKHPRWPVWGGFTQGRAGTARHDAVVWGYAHAADRMGVDIVQNCEVTGFSRSSSGVITGVETSRGAINADKVVISVAGSSTILANRAGFKLPVTSYALQAFVTEPMKPVLDVVSWSLATGVYVSQSDKGGLVFGGPLDLYNSYAQRGNFPVAMNAVGAIAEQYPSFGRARILRQWAGVVDVVQDSSPILDETSVPGLYISCGWGTGGFKAIPAGGTLMAHHVATGKPHDIGRPFNRKRFETGRLIDEAAGAGIAH